MLPSPPLTADSSCPSPRSLKRTFSNATDDTYTPPATPPHKRRRCPSPVSSPAAQEDIPTVEPCSFDPANLVTPPEYTHTPYDPEFGRKVCKQYRKSVIVQRACDAVSTEARRQKYGDQVALAHSPGSTPDHIRRSYEDEQRRLDEAFAEIIANSESEQEPDHKDDACVQSGEIERKLGPDRTSKFESRLSKTSTYRPASSRDLSARRLSDHGHQYIQPIPSLLRSDDSLSLFQHGNGVSNTHKASIEARAQSAWRISRLRRKYRLREQHRSSLMVGS